MPVRNRDTDAETGLIYLRARYYDPGTASSCTGIRPSLRRGRRMAVWETTHLMRPIRAA
jgi:hypothetical protein